VRVLIVDHTAGITPFRRKFAALAARPGIGLTVLAPDRWVENYREVRAKPVLENGYRLLTGSVVWPGYENRGFFVSGIAPALRASRPDLIHLWEEPFSLIALEALFLRRRLAPRAIAVFSTSDNLSFGFRYPYRGSWLYARIERMAHQDCAAALAINQRVVENLRSKGFSKPIEILPHGVTLEAYASPRSWPPPLRCRASSAS